MTATLYDIQTGRRRDIPSVAAAATPPRWRRPLSATIALFAAGLAPGFLLASAVSVQGGPGMVQAEQALAAASAAVCIVAAMRSRQIARRRARRMRQRVARQTLPSHVAPLRRAA
jgi:hypothetical protein